MVRTPHAQSEIHELTKRHIEEYFVWFDRVLDIHRNNFVFREVGPAELEQHKA
jgi:hypothetical protein